MKTIYLIFWIINAIVIITILPGNADGWVILRIFNLIIPCSLLFFRILIMHFLLNEADGKIPI